MNKESIIYVVVFTAFTAFVFVFLIAWADVSTAERVARNQELVTAQAFLNAVGRPEAEREAALKAYEEFFGSAKGSSAVRASVDGEEILIKQFSGMGLWGTVTGVLATDAEVKRIVGIDIISHSETPGLGGRIEQDWFKNQFRGERIPPEGIVVRKGQGGADEDSENGQVDGITGATGTSTSMAVMLNREIAGLRKEVGS